MPPILKVPPSQHPNDLQNLVWGLNVISHHFPVFSYKAQNVQGVMRAEPIQFSAIIISISKKKKWLAWLEPVLVYYVFEVTKNVGLYFAVSICKATSTNTLSETRLHTLLLGSNVFNGVVGSGPNHCETYEGGTQSLKKFKKHSFLSIFNTTVQWIFQWPS